jgi:hypothetical protein
VANGIISLLAAVGSIVLLILQLRQKRLQGNTDARLQAKKDALAHAESGDPDSAFNDVVGMPGNKS